jgi:Fur family ferric uptake transcriptional regulator
MSCQQDLFKQLRDRGFRLTPQREMVLSVMHETEGFSTAEEIYDQVQRLSSAIDISTVYRTLDLFQEFHVVATVDPGDGQRRYRLAVREGPHLHLVCRRCGSVTEMGFEEGQAIADCLRQQGGFEPDLENLSIPGLCFACRTALGQAVS